MGSLRTLIFLKTNMLTTGEKYINSIIETTDIYNKTHLYNITIDLINYFTSLHKASALVICNNQ